MDLKKTVAYSLIAAGIAGVLAFFLNQRSSCLKWNRLYARRQQNDRYVGSC